MLPHAPKLNIEPGTDLTGSSLSFDAIDTNLICSTTLDVQRLCHCIENIDAISRKTSGCFNFGMNLPALFVNQHRYVRR